MEFIEEFEDAINLWSQGDFVKAIQEKDPDDIHELAEVLTLIARYHFQPSNTKPNENFSFIANSSLSGGNHPCASPECRQDKLNQLIRFSSLYADEVYIQNPFESIKLKGAKRVNQTDRNELIQGINNFWYLKPFIEEGIIKYAQNEVSLCQIHNETVAKPLADRIQKKEIQLYDAIHKILIDSTSVTLDNLSGGGYFLEIKGSPNLIDHGKMYFHFYDQLPTYLAQFAKKTFPYKFSKTEITDTEILFTVINPILHDLSEQEWHSKFYGTSYLCDNKMQMQIASKLNSAAYAASSNAFEKGMGHYLPTIYSQDLTSLLNLRKSEEEAFKVYRDKLKALIHKSKPWDEKEVSSIFKDQLLPEINLIDKKIKDWKSKAKESIKEKIIFGSGAVGIGLYSGILPFNIGEIVAAVGGSSAVVGAVMDYNKTFKEHEEARSNDFYFLWQAQKVK